MQCPVLGKTAGVLVMERRRLSSTIVVFCECNNYMVPAVEGKDEVLYICDKCHNSVNISTLFKHILLQIEEGIKNAPVQSNGLVQY
jgi:hypothetical protein